jgi:hypothetical protein
MTQSLKRGDFIHEPSVRVCLAPMLIPRTLAAVLLAGPKLQAITLLPRITAAIPEATADMAIAAAVTVAEATAVAAIENVRAASHTYPPEATCRLKGGRINSTDV